MNTIIYSDSISSITSTQDNIDISFGSSNNKKPKKDIAIPVDNINEFIEFMNVNKYTCLQCKTYTIKTFNNYCINCLEYITHDKKFKEIIHNMFICVDKHKINCRYQIKKYIKRYSKIEIQSISNHDNITFQIKKHIIVYILKQLLQISRKNKVYVLQVYINKCIDILYSDNTILWLSVKEQELNRQSMIDNDTYFRFYQVYIIKNNIYVVFKYLKLNGKICNVCFINDNIYIPQLDNVSILTYKNKGYKYMVNCLLVHIYTYCIMIHK